MENFFQGRCYSPFTIDHSPPKIRSFPQHIPESISQAPLPRADECSGREWHRTGYRLHVKKFLFLHLQSLPGLPNSHLQKPDTLPLIFLLLLSAIEPNAQPYKVEARDLFPTLIEM